MAPQSPELVIIEVGLSALVTALGRKRAALLVECMAASLHERAQRSAVRGIKTPEKDRATAAADAAALAWYKDRLPALISVVSPETRI